MTKTRWTKDEVKVVIDSVKNNPTNLNNAFEIAAKKINKSSKSISQKYYKDIKHNSDLFTLKSSKVSKQNVKVETAPKVIGISVAKLSNLDDSSLAKLGLKKISKFVKI